MEESETEGRVQLEKTLIVADIIAPHLNGLTEKEFDSVFNLLRSSISQTKDPITIDFSPYVNKVKSRLNS